MDVLVAGWMHFPGHCVGAEADLAGLVVGQHDEDMTAVFIHPLPTLTDGQPLFVEVNTLYIYRAINGKAAVNAYLFHYNSVHSSAIKGGDDEAEEGQQVEAKESQGQTEGQEVDGRLPMPANGLNKGRPGQGDGDGDGNEAGE
jgi:hypothetical protein